MKLPNAYGSISKLSGNRRRPYMVRLTVGWSNTGKQLFKILGYYAKRSEALAALADYHNAPYDLNGQKLTFAEIYEKWKAERERSGQLLSNQYLAAYKRCAAIQDVPFKNLKTADFQKVIDSCSLGYASKKALRVVMGLVTKYALANDLAVKNYVELTHLPPAVASRIHVPFSAEEMEKLWGSVADQKVRTVLILCYTGMRPTEMLKIRKENVYLDERYMLGGIKTAAGKNRVIPISEKIFPFIQELYSSADTFLLEHDGQPMNLDKYRSLYWAPAMNSLRLNHLPHDGRHTCATMMDDKGINEKVKKMILGHAGKDITEKVYTHKTIAQLVEAINKI